MDTVYGDRAQQEQQTQQLILIHMFLKGMNRCNSISTNKIVFLSLVLTTTAADALQFPKIFGRGGKVPKVPILPGADVLNPVAPLKKKLLESVSYTANGKNASTEQQLAVLDLVRQLETMAPPDSDVLENPDKASQLLQGTWYLQYTSSSTPVETPQDAFPNAWKPQYTEQEQVETKPFQAKGTVSAAGVTVDTSNRIVTQSIDVDSARVTNNVQTDWGSVVAGGRFRPSTLVPNRALVTFDTLDITVDAINNWTIQLGFIFAISKAISGNKEDGWLETTYVDSDLRIGRGNKGTMFVLTRELDAVKP